MSDTIAEIVAFTRSISSQIGDLVEQGKKEELDALQRDIAAKRERVRGLASQYRQNLNAHLMAQAEVTRKYSNLAEEMQVSVAGRACLAAEAARLIQARDQLDGRPMLEHVHYAVLQCIADCNALSDRAAAELMDFDACLQKLNEELERAMQKILEMSGLLGEASEASNVIEAVFSELQSSLAEVEQQ
ncbi:unnamed protein product [Peniophora sp. CBMAI 1063]|nr:unnamed protein product [Peniophora sp. CBMAI 1063]